MSVRKNALKNINPAVYVVIATVFSYALLSIISLAGAIVCNLTDDPSALVGVVSFAALLICAAVSGAVISRVRGSGGVLLAILAAALFVVIRIVISLFLLGTDISDLLDCASYIGVSAIFALTAKKTKKRRR